MSTAAQKASSTVLAWTEKGLVPDSVIRAGIRRLCRQRLQDIRADDPEAAAKALDSFVEKMNGAPIALVPELANEQHYEVPPEFFDEVLGKHRKYSCCWWDEGVADLDQAETKALQITCERAGIEDGMNILDIGCGWGSLSLWIAEHYPGSTVTAVSNSAPQRRHIERLAAARGLDNLQVITRDMNDFAPGHVPERPYDRVVSVEMFEHMRNYRRIFRHIHGWLKPGGRFFMHIFCHRSTPYEYIDKGPSDWMSRHFFSGGIMPSAGLPLRFARKLAIDAQWTWNGKHYARTCRAWLRQMDRNKHAVMPILEETYGAGNGDRWFMRWRMFFMACEELFRYKDGTEWFVSHYRFRRAAD